jgi:small subunit ribosomal protein S6
MSKKTAFYEVVVVARPDQSRQDVEKQLDECAVVLKELGGKEIKREHWGLRGLAYRIEKHGKGYYALLGIEATAEAVHEISRKLRINEGVLRYLTARVEAIDSKPSPVMRSYDETDSDVAA